VKKDVLRKIKERNANVYCPRCGNTMTRCVEGFRAKTFEPYYDEGLNSDVYTEQDRQDIMKSLDLVEIGDKVGGARNFDEKNPCIIKKERPKGIRYKEKKEDVPKDFPVETTDAAGNVLSHDMFSKLESV